MALPSSPATSGERMGDREQVRFTSGNLLQDIWPRATGTKLSRSPGDSSPPVLTVPRTTSSPPFARLRGHIRLLRTWVTEAASGTSGVPASSKRTGRAGRSRIHYRRIACASMLLGARTGPALGRSRRSLGGTGELFESPHGWTTLFAEELGVAPLLREFGEHSSPGRRRDGALAELEGDLVAPPTCFVPPGSSRVRRTRGRLPQRSSSRPAAGPRVRPSSTRRCLLPLSRCDVLPRTRRCTAGPGRSRMSESRQERKVVTVLFCDLVGFTAQAEQLDPEDVRAVLGPYHSRLRAELERHGGTVEKFIGDAVMALFGAPVAHEDDPERAVRAALAIRDFAVEEALELRVGITTGEALVSLFANLPRGKGWPPATSSTPRLGCRARPQSTGSSRTRRPTGQQDRPSTIGRRPRRSQGQSRANRVWEALTAHARFGVDVAHEARTELVGRERELSVMRDAFDRARHERSRSS